MSTITTKGGAEIYSTDTGEPFDIPTPVVPGEDHHKFLSNWVRKSGRLISGKLIKGEKQSYCSSAPHASARAPRQGQRDVLAFIKS